MSNAFTKIDTEKFNMSLKNLTEVLTDCGLEVASEINKASNDVLVSSIEINSGAPIASIPSATSTGLSTSKTIPILKSPIRTSTTTMPTARMKRIFDHWFPESKTETKAEGENITTEEEITMDEFHSIPIKTLKRYYLALVRDELAKMVSEAIQLWNKEKCSTSLYEASTVDRAIDRALGQGTLIQPESNEMPILELIGFIKSLYLIKTALVSSVTRTEFFDSLLPFLSTTIAKCADHGAFTPMQFQDSLFEYQEVIDSKLTEFLQTIWNYIHVAEIEMRTNGVSPKASRVSLGLYLTLKSLFSQISK